MPDGRGNDCGGRELRDRDVIGDRMRPPVQTSRRREGAGAQVPNNGADRLEDWLVEIPIMVMSSEPRMPTDTAARSSASRILPSDRADAVAHGAP
jgi:hypothetical protein